jgi:hypothetical protein
LTDFNGRSPISAVLGVPEARAVVSEVAPELLDSSTLLPGFPLKSVMRLVLGEDDPRVETILERVSEFQDPRPVPPEEPAIAADEQYEPESVERASAAVELPAEAEKTSLGTWSFLDRRMATRSLTLTCAPNFAVAR